MSQLSCRQRAFASAAITACAVTGLAACNASTSTAKGASSPSPSPIHSSATASEHALTAQDISTGCGASGGDLVDEPTDGFASIDTAITSAKSSINLTMYELVDSTITSDLEAAAARGVNVRVILDTNGERKSNTPAFQDLSGHGVHVVWAETGYAFTHQKTLTVDADIAWIMSANLTSRYYSSTRDFLIRDTNAADIAAITSVFNADYDHDSVSPGAGCGDLVWSPTSAEPDLLGLINDAHSTLIVENEEMASAAITDALAAAAQRGVHVTVVMTYSSDWKTAFATLEQAGVKVLLYRGESYYIHAKAIVADSNRAYVGSINFSNGSMTRNRELGIIESNSSFVSALDKQLTADAAGATSDSSSSSSVTAAPKPTTAPMPITAPKPTSAAGLSCKASVDNPNPSDGSTIHILISTAPSAELTATAHYKTTDTTHTGTADGSGSGSIAYDIGRASKGYAVTVDVTAALGGRSASCSTSFVPQ